MSAVREACPNCQLPFYTERNSECPYCGATPGNEPPPSAAAEVSPGAADTTVAGSVARGTPPERPRVTCAHCGLPHYADDGNGCPYCDAAGVSPTESLEDTTAAAAGESADAGSATTQEADSPAEAARADQSSTAGTSGSSGGILASLKRLVGL